MVYPGFYKDKTITDKLMYIPNDGIQNDPPVDN